ncbi:MAG TPA: gamma-glutamylcyclotransferase family protein [Chitinophagaceae bacterium]|nr:gamma-glutamylcyclotransferase family protein [Chitinophagaceae bacterium]
MFHYFGYGSNINLISLKAKGVEPDSSEWGMIPGWRLKFNVQHWFRHEGGVGNIEPTADESNHVEGMLHTCEDRYLANLDTMEAYGVGYDRILVDVTTRKGTVKAFAYVGLPDQINEQCLPSRRYLNIIIKGAMEAGLSEEYIERLRMHPVHIPEDYPEYIIPKVGTVFNADSLAHHPYYTAVAGAVFDMSKARKQLECLWDLFGGKDTTLFHLRRLDSSNGTETLEDVIHGRISEQGKNYLNAYLHEYNREFRFIGRYHYQ